MAIKEPAKVYNVSGGGSSSAEDSSYLSSSLPDLLRRHGSSNKRKQRKSVVNMNNELAKIELLQDFEFPEASNRIKSTKDGQHIVATGTYKPQMRVWECEQLSLKFERHSDAENVDFVMLSDDWTKSLHLQNDRTVELHNQGGHHVRVRIPRFGRSLDHHFSTATALIGASGNEVYRLNLDQGRFLAPFQLASSVTGVNVINVNPAHGMCAFGVEGVTEENGGVELWDSRDRVKIGSLSIATRDVLDASMIAARRGILGPKDADDSTLLAEAIASLSVTALSTSTDGLNIAVGTNTGHTLLYDLRMSKPYATKDQGFGLPIKTVSWPSDSLPLSEKRVLSSDSKVIKVWSPSQASENMVTITPSVGTGDLNDVHHLPGTGLILSANESTRCNGWYVPDLGVAPKWCSFLDVLTDEADAEATGGKGTYEDFKFIDQGELDRLNLGHLIGSDVLRPYMHGFFISLSLYDKARLISNPTAYEDARERAIKNKIEKLAESRIRESPKEMSKRRKNEKELEGIRINRELAEKIQKKSERQGKKSSEETAQPDDSKKTPSNLLNDDRFKELFTNPEFQVDQSSREFALLNPSTAVAAKSASSSSKRDLDKQKLTAVEEEDLDSDKESIDPDQESEEEEEADEDDGADSDSSQEGNLGQFDPRLHYRKRRSDLEKDQERGARPVDDDDSGPDNFDRGQSSSEAGSKRRTFGERARGAQGQQQGGAGARRGGDGRGVVGDKSVSWTPASSDNTTRVRPADGEIRTKKQETFGKGLSKGAGREEGLGVDSLSKDERFGREKRRKPNRSASGNVMKGRR